MEVNNSTLHLQLLPPTDTTNSTHRFPPPTNLGVDDSRVGGALDAARVRDGRRAEEHGAKRRRSAKPRRLLEEFGNLLLHELEKATPAGGDAVCVRQHLEIGAGRREVFPWRGDGAVRLVGRDDQQPRRASEEDVGLPLT